MGRKLHIETGNQIILTTDEVEGTPEKISISYAKLPSEVKKGTLIYIADGVLGLEVTGVKGNDIYCTIIAGGELGQKKNVNVVGVKTSLPAMATKDKEDLVMGVKEGIDFVAASFIRKASDVIEIRNHLDANGGESVRILAKIEDEEGLENIDEILKVADGVMVARGDLGVQIKIEDIPLAQKKIIERCNKAGKPVITATQMLDSMINNPRPTRAETNDVANAIFDGTDAVMLSGETAQGKYPVETVDTMARIARTVESSQEFVEHTQAYFEFHKERDSIGDAVAKAGYVVASNINAKAIVTPTMGGTTPRLMSKFKPTQSIVATTMDEKVQRHLLLDWGVIPLLTKEVSDTEEMLRNSINKVEELGLGKKGDNVVMLAGVPVQSKATLNMVRVDKI